MGYVFGILLGVIAVFLILLVLVQRGRGGGLTGALGGMGGSSAFGAKAGDVFTRITIVTAAIWIVVCLAAGFWAGGQGTRLGDDSGVLGTDLPITGPDTTSPSTDSLSTETPPSETAESPPSEPAVDSPPADTPVGDAAAPTTESGEADQ